VRDPVYGSGTIHVQPAGLLEAGAIDQPHPEEIQVGTREKRGSQAGNPRSVVATTERQRQFDGQHPEAQVYHA